MKTLFQILGVLALMALGGRIGRCTCPRGPMPQPAETRIDTVIVRDTIRIQQPEPVIRRVVRVDTVWMKQATGPASDSPAPRRTSDAHYDLAAFTTDGIGIVNTPTPDSVRVEVPIERSEYATADYRAVVEGFGASLVSLEIYRQTRFVDRVQTIRVPDRKRWGFGLQAGYGATIRDGRLVAAPTIGVGVSYNLVRW